MNDYQSSEQQVGARSIVRRNAGSAAIAAVLMCAYGFGSLALPEPKDLFLWCNLILYYALRIGGIGFGIIAIWSLIGHLPALAADGVLSIVCGVIFMVTAVGMWIDGGIMFISAVYLFFGWLFTGVGVRNWRTYQHLVRFSAPGEYDDFDHAAWRESPRATEALLHDDAPQDAERDVDRLMYDQPDSNEYETDSPDDITETADDESGRHDGGFLAGFGRTGTPPGV